MWTLEMISHLLLTLTLEMRPRHQPQLLQGLHMKLAGQAQQVGL